MSEKGGYLSTLPSLNDHDYRSASVASFVADNKYGKEISVINPSKQVLRGESLFANCRRRKRILVVDDEFDTNFTIKVVLETDKFKVDSFTDPHAALRNFATGLYDLAIIDLTMPVMNGFAYIARLGSWITMLKFAL
jgi:PleD family two-component response regulator